MSAADLQALDAVVAEVELFQLRAVLQARHGRQSVALHRQLAQGSQAAQGTQHLLYPDCKY